jgi:hypothetical protein
MRRPSEAGEETVKMKRARANRTLLAALLALSGCSAENGDVGRDAAGSRPDSDGGVRVVFGDAGLDRGVRADGAADGSPTTDGRVSDAVGTRDAPASDAEAERDAAGADSAAADAQPEPDASWGDDFTLVVPAGVQACTMDTIATGDLSRVFERKARVSFRPGSIRLFRDEAQFEADWISRVEVGRDALRAVPSGVGLFVRTVEGNAVDRSYRYVFEQTFAVDGHNWMLRIALAFEGADNSSLERVKILDARALADREFTITLKRSDGTISLYLGPCDYSAYSCRVMQVTFEGGDALELDACSYCPPRYICKRSAGGLRRATFTRGRTSRVQRDHFKLAYSNRHHNWGHDSLVLFDRPVGEIHGVYLGTEPYPNFGMVKTVRYLDAELNVIEERDVLR